MDGSGKCERSEEVDRGDERSDVFFFVEKSRRGEDSAVSGGAVGVQQENRCAQFV